MTRSIVWAAVLFLSSTPAQGQLVGADWKTKGDALLTLDPSTGLRWLDLTETYNQSLSDVTPELSQYGRLSGFRVATLDEVWRLIQDAGLPQPIFLPPINPYAASYDPLIVAKAEAATGLLGETVGRYWTPDWARPDLLIGTRGYLWDNGAESNSGFWVQESSFLLYYTNVPVPGIPGSGVWLVQAVPEPGAISWIGILLLTSAITVRTVRRLCGWENI